MDFKLGDSVKVIRSDHREDYYMVGLITEIGEGFLPYRVHLPEQSHAGYWHKEDDLELATEQPATALDGGGDETYETLSKQVERGTAEMRRYVEGNGFTWCEDEDTVFNVTTALGLMGGEIATLRAQLAAAEATAAGLRRERDAAVSVFTPYKSQLAQLLDLTLEGDIVIRHNLSRGDVSKLVRQGFLSQVNGNLWITTAAEMLMQAADAKPAGGA